MTTLEKRVRAIRWRLEWLNFCRRFVRLVLIALSALVLCVAVSKFVRLPLELARVGPWAMGATIPLALLWAVLTRTSVRRASILTDERLQLRERISSALLTGFPQTPMEAALAADAESHALPLRAHRAFPMPVWRDLYYMPIPVVAMALIGVFVPQIHLFGRKEERTEAPLSTQSQKDLARRLDSFQRELEKVAKTAPPVQARELSSEMQNLLRALESKQPLSQTDVMKKISAMSDRLSERKETIEKKLAAAQQLEKFHAGEMTRKIGDALARGNFEQGKAEMAKLADALKQGAFSKEQQTKLSGEMKSLSDALKENPALSQAFALAARSLATGDLDKALSELQLSADALQDLAETLRQMQELDKLAQCLQALRACESCGCGCSTCSVCCNYAALLAMMGKFREGDTTRFGAGMGGPGRGMGGQPEFKETPTQFQPTKARMKLDKGDIIGVVRVWGPQLKGEATAKFEQAYFEYRQAAEDTLLRENIPLEYRTLVRDYFDAIQPATEGKKGNAER